MVKSVYIKYKVPSCMWDIVIKVILFRLRL